MSYPIIGLVVSSLFLLAAWILADQPVWRSLLGHVALLASAAALPIVVWRRRTGWAGCQRLFWDTMAAGMVLWLVGHLGWAFDLMVVGVPSWLHWHTLFSLCAGIAPLIALLARPHRGGRPQAVATAALDQASYGLLAVFIYAYFVLVPSFVPGGLAAAQRTLLHLIELNRFALLSALVAAMWVARATTWKGVYGRLALGVAVGLVLRVGTNAAIGRGEYYPGTFYDLAWIIPWLSYAWAAVTAPRSVQTEAVADPAQNGRGALSVVPLLLVPLLGYGGLYVQSLGAPGDSFRALLTGLTIICGLALVMVRMTVQGWELRRADARLKLLAAATEQTGDLILITRADGTFEHANEAFVRALGYGRRELAAMPFQRLLDEASGRLGRVIPADVRDYGMWRGTLQRRRKNGSTFPAACTVVGLKDEAGVITHFVGVERDISEELWLRDQLVQSERLSAIGELVAGVAHEINNPLQTIVGCVELMLDERSGSVDRRDLTLVRNEAARAGQIVRNLLAFVRRGTGDRAPADLNDIVRSIVALREYHLHQTNIAVTCRYAEGPLPIVVNRDEIQQVVMNLLLNAEHAIAAQDGHGVITLETGISDGRHYVEVLDTGPGIRPELRGRIFEPFFTTKEVGQGTGLGLSISHGIASAHGGALDLLESSSGARFRLSLPPHVRTHAAERAVQPAAGPRRALVVDDEPAIRGLMGRLLNRRGFEVLEAATGDEALSLATSTPLTLVFCDVRMPGMNGTDLYERLISAAPALDGRFIFITGDASLARTGATRNDLPLLTKPFTAADLDSLLGRMQLG